MRKAFKYRIYPTKRQERLLIEILALCCELYNAALQERRDAYKIARKSISYTIQQNQLPDIKKTRKDLADLYSMVLQDVLHRVDNAFDGFLTRLKNGKKPGYPRFRSRSRYRSITYPQADNGSAKIVNGNLALSKIGHIKIKVHRPIEGRIKTCMVKHSSTGKWFAIFSCEVEVKPLPVNGKAVGADVGLESFATLSNGEKISNPRFLRKEEKELAKAQRQLSAATKGSKEGKEKKKKVARIHERINNKRHNFVHQQSAKIIKEYGIICIEELKILNMVRNHCLAKSIMDAAWSLFFSCLLYKAECAGRKIAKVPPRHTSQDCHKCGHRRTDLTLSDRIYHCANAECDLVIDRDVNAALNILRLGLQSLGLRPIEAPA